MPDPTTPKDAAPDSSPDPALDQSMPESPLIAEDHAPLRPPLSLLDASPTTRRMENLDALRVLAMFVIIVTHVTQPYLDHLADAARPYSPLYQSLFALNVACRFGVPCFLMISFYIYWHQLYDKHRTWGELLARRLKRLVPAFLAWSLIYFALHKVLAGRDLDVIPGPLGERLNWKDLGVWREVLLLGRAHDHLYYLPVVICSLLLIPLLRVLWPRPAVSWAWIAATLVAWTAVAYGATFAPESSAASRAVARAMWLWRNLLALPLLCFPLLGMMSAGQRAWREFIAKTPTSLWVGLTIAGLALHIAETLLFLDAGTTDQSWPQALAGLKVGRFLTAVPIFVLILRHPLMRDPFPKLSHHAFGLHFMHPAVIIALTLAERKLLGDNAAEWRAMVVPILAVNLALTLGITCAMCRVIGRVKRLEFLVV